MIIYLRGAVGSAPDYRSCIVIKQLEGSPLLSDIIIRYVLLIDSQKVKPAFVIVNFRCSKNNLHSTKHVLKTLLLTYGNVLKCYVKNAALQ